MRNADFLKVDKFEMEIYDFGIHFTYDSRSRDWTLDFYPCAGDARGYAEACSVIAAITGLDIGYADGACHWDVTRDWGDHTESVSISLEDKYRSRGGLLETLTPGGDWRAAAWESPVDEDAV